VPAAEVDVRGLACAVLERAMFDLRAGGYEAHLREAAVAWVWSDTNEHLFSFAGCCFMLDLDPERVRRALAAKHRRGG